MGNMAHPSPPALVVAIQATHQAISEHPDPQAKQTLAVCLQNMLKIQHSDMQQQQQGPQQGPPQQGPPQQGVMG